MLSIIDLVRLDDDKAFNTSLELLERTYKQRQPESSQNGGDSTRNGYKPKRGETSCEDPIRDAMGLD